MMPGGGSEPIRGDPFLQPHCERGWTPIESPSRWDKISGKVTRTSRGGRAFAPERTRGAGGWRRHGPEADARIPTWPHRRPSSLLSDLTVVSPPRG